MELPFGRKSLERKISKALEEQRALDFIEGVWPAADGANGNAVASVSRALSLVPVFGAARTLGDDIASLTPVLYTLNSQGIPVRQPTPSLFAQPSIHGTLYDWLFRAVVSMALQGDAIGLVTARDYYGWPTMVEWLNPEQVATQDGKLYGPGSYMNPMWWWWGRPIDPRELIHIPWFTMPYRVRGLSPIGAYQLTTDIGISAKEYHGNWFGQGGVPPGTLKNNQKTFDHTEGEKLANKLVARLQSRKPLVYGVDWDYTPIAIKPNEAQFVETMRLTATDIAVIYGLPPQRLGGSTGESMTYSTVELNNIDYLTHSLRPWLRRLEYVLTACFPRNYFVRFDTDEMMLLDAKTRAEVDSTSLGFQNAGWKDRDEVRTTYSLPPQGKPNVVPPQPDPKQTPNDLNDDDNKTGQPQLNGNGNNGHSKVSGTNAHLSGTRALEQMPPRRYKDGRKALIEVMEMEVPAFMRERVESY
jgi:HK97 family phage portal protein